MSCKTDNSFHFVNFVINIRLCLYLKENLHKNWSCVIISFHCITNSGSGTAYHSWTPEFTPFFMFHVPRSWIFLWCCADHCLFVLFLFLIHVCIVCLSSIYSFWLTLWELPAFFLSEYQDTDVTTKFNWQYTNNLWDTKQYSSNLKSNKETK
jgi:hypothetical protein